MRCVDAKRGIFKTLLTIVKVKVLPALNGALGGAYLRFYSPRPRVSNVVKATAGGWSTKFSEFKVTDEITKGWGVLHP